MISIPPGKKLICAKPDIHYPPDYSPRLLKCAGKRLKSSEECPRGCLYFFVDDPRCQTECGHLLEKRYVEKKSYEDALKKIMHSDDDKRRYYYEQIEILEVAPTYCEDEHTAVTCGYDGLTNGLSYAAATRKVCAVDEKCGPSKFHTRFNRDGPAPFICQNGDDPLFPSK
jgi:hypothetical protein